MNERMDDYEKRRAHLAKMSDEELKSYFWELSEKLVDPLLDMAYTHTSKSIERSVLLRMGFSSIEAKAITEVLDEHNLLRKGAGQSVYILHKEFDISLREAGKLIQNGDKIDYLLERYND